MLLAWLDNNYWDTNFEVTQSGPLTTRLTLIPHDAEPVGRSVTRALPYVVEPQIHFLRGSGETRASLFEVDLDDLLITGVERSGHSIRLFLLNPDDTSHTLRLGQGQLRPVAARAVALDGRPGAPCPVTGGTVTFEVSGRAWTALQIELA